MSSTNPVEGALRGGFLGAAFLGGFHSPFATLFTAFGSMVGSTHGTYRNLTDTTWVPSEIKAKRELHEYFDYLQYLKAKALYEQTGNDDYLKNMKETWIYQGNLGSATSKEAYRSLPYQEKPYFWAFLKVNDPKEQKKILQSVSPQMATMLQEGWRIHSDALNSTAISQQMGDYFSSHHLPNADWGGWSPSIQLEDVQMKTAQREGFDAHDFGLGWYEQEYRLRMNHSIPGALDMYDTSHNPAYGDMQVSSSEVESVISGTLAQFGIEVNSIHITTQEGGGGNINVALTIEESPVSELSTIVGSI
jgi:hypothetical protein